VNSFSVDMPALEATFKRLQSKLHPDKFGACTRKEQEASMASSSTINQGYQLLRSDAERANYLLRLVFGVDPEETSSSASTSSSRISRRSNDSLFMAEVFEMREQIEDNAADRAALELQLQQVKQETVKVVAALDSALKKKQAEAFEQAAVRLQYYLKIKDELAEAIDALVEHG
jgi:molecular chaperone HscB